MSLHYPGNMNPGNCVQIYDLIVYKNYRRWSICVEVIVCYISVVFRHSIWHNRLYSIICESEYSLKKSDFVTVWWVACVASWGVWCVLLFCMFLVCCCRFVWWLCQLVYLLDVVRDARSALTSWMPAVSNCCRSKGSASYWSNPPFLIFDIQALWRSVLSTRAPECQKFKTVC